MSTRTLKELVSSLNAYVDRLEAAVDNAVAGSVAFTVRQRMLQMIRAGVSPILGAGRFPEYKGATTRARLRNEARLSRNLLRQTKSGSRAGRLRALASAKRAAAKNPGYPFSVQSKFPQKKPRPVNLTLSGKFLSSLNSTITKVGKRVKISIGFFSEDQAKKEKGHREGANGQRPRPIIPKGNESFSETIKADILSIIRQAVRRAGKKTGANQ